jgi:ribosome-binding protein aMBF1 (putative translation factor)
MSDERLSAGTTGKKGERMNDKRRCVSNTAKNAPQTEVVDLPALVQRLGHAERITHHWRKEHSEILREVGQAMRQGRQRRKVSLRSLAKQLGCSAPFLSDMERGNRKYSIEWCRKAAAILSLNAPVLPPAESNQKDQ